MSEPRAAGRFPTLASVALSLVAAALFVALALARPGLDRLWGDEGTFVAMTTSLVRDGDLRFAEPDRRWAETRAPGGATLILQQSGGGVFYSKPVVYALLAAPGLAIAGEWGMVATNALLWLSACWLGWLYLRRLGERGPAGLVLATFALAAVAPVYVLWRMSDLAQAAFALAGLVLCCAALRRPAAADLPGAWLDRGWTAAAGGALLGLAAAMRIPNALLPLAAVAAALLLGRRRRALVTAAAALLALAAITGATYQLTGAVGPYKSVRSSFNATTGYPGSQAKATGAAAVGAAAERFARDPATNRLGVVPRTDFGRAAYSLVYFLVGRHSGLALYFPAALALALFALRRLEPLGAVMLAGVAALAGFYLLWLPDNYFGGSTFAGNRYFLTAYPALLVALPRLPPPRYLLPVWTLALVVGGSALVSVERVGKRDPMSQSHTAAGVFRAFPYESTGRRIDGQRDRYWSGDFVRFVDSYAAVEADSFELVAGDPATELLVATTGERGPLHFLVSTEAARAELEVADWGKNATFALAPEVSGSRAHARFTPSPAWRHHRFWFEPEAVYRVHTLRLKLRAADGVRARVLYRGDGIPLAVERSIRANAPR